MRIGLLGAGRIGRSHAEVASAHPDVTELVVADTDQARARDVAQVLGCEQAGAMSDVLASGVDGIVVASGTSSHAELVRAGVDAKVPVFCEKPVALDVTETRRVLTHVEQGAVPVQVGFQRRFDAGYVAARRAVCEGRIGQLHRAHLVTGDQTPPSADYLATSGGMFRDCHIHDFDILRWVTGREVASVFAVGANRGAEHFERSGDVDNAAALLRMDDDTLVTLQGSRYNGAGHDVRMELAGTRATYGVGLDERVPLTPAEPDVAFPSGTPWPSFAERFRAAYAAEIDAFVEVVRGTRPTPCGVAEALEALCVAEAAERSRAEGRVVEIAEVRT